MTWIGRVNPPNPSQRFAHVHQGATRAQDRAPDGRRLHRRARRGSAQESFLVDEAGEGAVAMMRTIKRALDPLDIMNPGKVFR